MENEFFAPVRQSTGMGLVDPAAVSAAEQVKAMVQAAYIMALQRPRNEADARDRILRACKRPEFAGKAEYSKPVGGGSIKGPSIRFAELAMQNWGNLRAETAVVYEDEKIRRLRISCVDLETNAQFCRDISIKKTIERSSKAGRADDVLGTRTNTRGKVVYILKATDEEMHTKESAWVSKVIRNEGLRLIPSDIIDEGMRMARQTLEDRAAASPDKERKTLLDAFSGVGVRPKELERYLGHAIDHISPGEIVDLRTVYRSIKDGESSWHEILTLKAGGSTEAPPDPPQDKPGTEIYDAQPGPPGAPPEPPPGPAPAPEPPQAPKPQEKAPVQSGEVNWWAVQNERGALKHFQYVRALDTFLDRLKAHLQELYLAPNTVQAAVWSKFKRLQGSRGDWPQPDAIPGPSPIRLLWDNDQAPAPDQEPGPEPPPQQTQAGFAFPDGSQETTGATDPREPTLDGPGAVEAKDRAFKELDELKQQDPQLYETEKFLHGEPETTEEALKIIANMRAQIDQYKGLGGNHEF